MGDTAGRRGWPVKNSIFIEGVSGVGKSSTVQGLGEALRKKGHRADVFPEGNVHSPLDLCWVAYLTNGEYARIRAAYPAYADDMERNVMARSDYVLLRYQIGTQRLFPQTLHAQLGEKEFCYKADRSRVPMSRFMHIFEERWRAYAQDTVPKPDYAIFDASLIGHTTNDLTHAYQACARDIAAHVNTLLRTVESLQPKIFYLACGDLRTRLVRARKSRGQTPPTEAQFMFWEKRRQMDMAVLPMLSVASVVIDVPDENWDGVIPEILTHLL